MKTKMLVKKPEAVSNKTNSPVNNNNVNNKQEEEKKPEEKKKNVRTTDYKKLMQMMLNDPDSITREEFLYIQSIIGYRRAMVMMEEAKLRKRQNKIEQKDIRNPITLQKINSDDKKDSDDKKETSQLKKGNGKKPLQMKKDEGNNAASSSGIPSNLKSGLEKLSGVDLSDVNVHQNSDKPQQVGALAYTQGNDIHIAPGQEKHLPHEGWHAVQQKQGIVKPTMQMKTGTLVNDDAGLEKEADIMGAKAAEIGKDISAADASSGQSKNSSNSGSKGSGDFVVQKKDEGTESKPKINESDLEEIQLKGMTDFKATTKIDEYLKENTSGANIKVRYGNFASGTVKISKSGQNYKMTPQAISLSMNPFSNQENMVKTAQPSLIISINKGKLTGYLGIANGSKVPSSNDLLSQLISDPSMFGLRGLTLDKSLQIVNSINEGRLEFGIRNATVKVGGVFDCTISFEFEPDTGKISFSGTANIDVKGLATGNLTLERSSQGNITGTAELAVNLSEHINGGVKVNVDGERVTGEGSVGYSGEKLSGQVTLRLIDKNSMPSVVGTYSNEAAKPEPQSNKSKNPEYVLAGEGDLTFMFTDWLSGTAHAEVDENGNVTIVGQIVPQKELVLFEQTDYIKQLLNVEARASYGIPVVGNIFLFASIGLEAFAKLGPAKLYNIIAEGTYSTDPEKCNDFSIQASLNISAAAGVRLIGKAGAGLEVLGHDIKAGASITAIAGLSAYAEATPIIGYKENAMPGQDKKGDFFISGELEVAAQPFFALEGDIFVEIDSPWWSPLSDERWTWPLFNKSYPLGGSFGIMAKVDHVLGSKQVPEIEFGKVDFSADKFMTDLINDKTSSKKTEEEQQGKWNEKNSEAAQPPKDTKEEKGSENGTDSTLNVEEPNTSSKSNKKTAADPNAMTADGKTVKQYQDETLQNQAKGDVKPDGACETTDKTSSEKKNQDQQLIQGLNELEKLTSEYEKNNGATLEELQYEANEVKKKYSVFKSINIVDDGKDWDYKYTYNPTETKDGPKKGDEILSPKAKFKQDSKTYELWVERGKPGSKENVVMITGPKNIEEDKTVWDKLDKTAKDKVYKLKQPKNKKYKLKEVEEATNAIEKCLAGESKDKIIRNWKGEEVKIPEGHIMSPRDPDFSKSPIYRTGPYTKEQKEQFLRGNSAGTKLAPHHRHQIPIRDGGVIDEIPGSGHPEGNQHTGGSPNRHPGKSIFNSEPGGDRLRQKEIEEHWKSKGQRLVEKMPGTFYDFG
ncbi:DUF4157 domain-containing protein [Ruminiclostridium herbifermentans]|uniref:DUF4157 domain-containing protein n=1 Tax=Ruminiclostridium herbifermentans TaxID=2488810 RepID=A0A4U7JDK1_9FIRM|nr:DUF4157 domain-containing protein [Ruminiclostridium herbifermentans]QNU67686.1 DUF4157 domain-containing protein [Ruminiclostridium herbifermentans]